MYFNLENGIVKVATHRIEWSETVQRRPKGKEPLNEIITYSRLFYNPYKKDAFVKNLTQKSIEVKVEELEQLPQEVSDKLLNKQFNNRQEVQDFIEKGIEKVTLEGLAEVVADLIGGAI